MPVAFSFFIYPNPVSAKENAKLQFSVPFHGQVQLFNAAGQVLKIENVNTGSQLLFSYQIPDLAAGAYFISVNDKEKNITLTERIIIN